MEITTVAQHLHGIPNLTGSAAQELYRFIVDNNVRDILELGTAHGASACWMAAALDETGSGQVTTIDLKSEDAMRAPNLSVLIPKTGLGKYIQQILTDRSYLWELMKLIEQRTVGGVCQPCFDFCFIDGAHTWDVDGFAFFLVDKLLRPGGWILFDDLHWTLEGMYSSHGIAPRGEPLEERTTAQVAKVFGLLVAQHPDYGSVRIEGDWGWAQKMSSRSEGQTVDPSVLEKVYGTTVKRDAYLLARRAAIETIGKVEKVRGRMSRKGE